MTDTLGARLRRAREQRGVSLASIAATTKITVGLLEALEEDDVSHWPSGIFRRAFIRSYAQGVGLDPDAIAREFLDLYPDPFDIDSALNRAPNEAVPAAGGPPSEPQGRNARAVKALAEPATRMLGRLRAALGSGTGPEVDSRKAEAHSTEATIASMGSHTAARPPIQRVPELSAAANLCTELARVAEPRDVPPLLERLATLLNAVGIVVWVSDRTGQHLKPAMAYGYSEAAAAQMARVQRIGDTATTAAFRSTQPKIVAATDAANGAIAIPLMTPTGCAGVLAAELRDGGEQSEWVSAIARIFAAQLAMLIAVPPTEVHQAHA